MARLPHPYRTNAAACSTLPRVSSPLAQYSTSSSYESESGEEEESSSQGGDSDDDDEDEMALDGLLQAAKDRAVARNSPSNTGGESANLQDADLALAGQECVSAVYFILISD